jgi:hypothetical protein
MTPIILKGQREKVVLLEFRVQGHLERQEARAGAGKQPTGVSPYGANRVGVGQKMDLKLTTYTEGSNGE